MRAQLILIIAAAILCGCKKGKNAIVWKVSFVDASITMNDGHYLFSSSYIELPSSVKDSTIAVDIFYENNNKSSVYVYESYPYKSVIDFNSTSNITPIEDREFKGKEIVYKQIKIKLK